MIETLKHRLHLLAYAFRTVGLCTMFRNSLAWSLDREARNSNSDFDSRFGTDTTTELTGWSVSTNEAWFQTTRNAVGC